MGRESGQARRSASTGLHAANRALAPGLGAAIRLVLRAERAGAYDCLLDARCAVGGGGLPARAGALGLTCALRPTQGGVGRAADAVFFQRLEYRCPLRGKLRLAARNAACAAP